MIGAETVSELEINDRMKPELQRFRLYVLLQLKHSGVSG